MPLPREPDHIDDKRNASPHKMPHNKPDKKRPTRAIGANAPNPQNNRLDRPGEKNCKNDIINRINRPSRKSNRMKRPPRNPITQNHKKQRHHSANTHIHNGQPLHRKWIFRLLDQIIPGKTRKPPVKNTAVICSAIQIAHINRIDKCSHHPCDHRQNNGNNQPPLIDPNSIVKLHRMGKRGHNRGFGIATPGIRKRDRNLRLLRKHIRPHHKHGKRLWHQRCANRNQTGLCNNPRNPQIHDQSTKKKNRDILKRHARCQMPDDQIGRTGYKTKNRRAIRNDLIGIVNRIIAIKCLAKNPAQVPACHPEPHEYHHNKRPHRLRAHRQRPGGILFIGTRFETKAVKKAIFQIGQHIEHPQAQRNIQIDKIPKAHHHQI